MDITNLILTLQDKINSESNSLTNLIAIKALNQLKTGSVRYITSFAELPTASTNTGMLYFVQNDLALYWSTGESWLSIINTSGIRTTWSWGAAACGVLGDGTVTNRSSPGPIVGGITDWATISAGTCHDFGIRSDGTLWAWGLGTSGQLGNCAAANSSSPVSVVGGFVDWSQVSAGSAHSLGVRSDGTAWAWGINTCGVLGDCTTVAKSSPVSVVGGFIDWCQVSAGGGHSLGLRSNGTLWAWGCNGQGRLGDCTTTNRSSPVSVVGGFINWCDISAGNNQSFAIRTTGTLWAWGCNTCGVLGDGTVVSRSSPVSVAGGFVNWCAVSAGCTHTLALRADGTAWAWGCNGTGRLGIGITTNRSSPVQVCGGFADWCDISAGCTHSLGIKTDGTIWAWGNNGQGRLGDYSAADRSSPVSVIGGFTDWCQVSAGGAHSLGLRSANF